MYVNSYKSHFQAKEKKRITADNPDNHILTFQVKNQDQDQVKSLINNAIRMRKKRRKKKGKKEKGKEERLKTKEIKKDNKVKKERNKGHGLTRHPPEYYMGQGMA